MLSCHQAGNQHITTQPYVQALLMLLSCWNPMVRFNFITLTLCYCYHLI